MFKKILSLPFVLAITFFMKFDWFLKSMLGTSACYGKCNAMVFKENFEGAQELSERWLLLDNISENFMYREFVTLNNRCRNELDKSLV